MISRAIASREAALKISVEFPQSRHEGLRRSRERSADALRLLPLAQRIEPDMRVPRRSGRAPRGDRPSCRPHRPRLARSWAGSRIRDRARRRPRGSAPRLVPRARRRGRFGAGRSEVPDLRFLTAADLLGRVRERIEGAATETRLPAVPLSLPQPAPRARIAERMRTTLTINSGYSTAQ